MENAKITRILIVEDEALIADHLAACLQADGYAIAGIKDEAEDALEFLQADSPDLILLDIQLAGALDGVDLAASVHATRKIPVVFLTSNTDARTLARVKLTHPAGFIVKPFQPSDLRPAIELALYAQQYRQESAAAIPPSEEDSFFIKEKQEMHRVYYRDILCAEALDNYTRIHLSGKRYTVSQTLKVLEEKLNGHGFFRIHRTWLVNVAKISCIRPTEVVVGEMTLPSSTNARSELLRFVQTF